MNEFSRPRRAFFPRQAPSYSGSHSAPQKREPPPGSDQWRTPWVQVKYFAYHPCMYRSMLRVASPDAKSGDLVHVYDKEGNPFGVALYNKEARVPLRVLAHGDIEANETLITSLVDRACDLRGEVLRLESTDAYRVVNSDADALSGLIVDRYADTLSIETHSLGMYLRLPQIIAQLHTRLGTSRQIVHVEPRIARMEDIRIRNDLSAPNVREVKICENGIRYAVNFEEGHKTGFFCDQRPNRLRLSQWVKDKRVLDLCCYTGGFALSAKLTGQAADVTAVDLDEKAIAQAKRNANLNQTRVNWVHADAFSYARQMQQNGEQWDVVILDPPKFMDDREAEDDGLRRYEDLNMLGISLLKTGGLLVTCSCSGLLSPAEFERMLIRAAHRRNRRLQFLDFTGPGCDHPVMSNCPESRYLKVAWARLF